MRKIELGWSYGEVRLDVFEDSASVILQVSYNLLQGGYSENKS